MNFLSEEMIAAEWDRRCDLTGTPHTRPANQQETWRASHRHLASLLSVTIRECDDARSAITRIAEEAEPTAARIGWCLTDNPAVPSAVWDLMYWYTTSEYPHNVFEVDTPKSEFWELFAAEAVRRSVAGYHLRIRADFDDHRRIPESDLTFNVDSHMWAATGLLAGAIFCHTKNQMPVWDAIKTAGEYLNTDAWLNSERVFEAAENLEERRFLRDVRTMMSDGRWPWINEDAADASMFTPEQHDQRVEEAGSLFTCEREDYAQRVIRLAVEQLII